jgi:outer membrane protein
MKNRFKAIIVALLMLVPALSFAQKAYKFGHVNKQDIIQVLPDRDTAIVKLQKFQKDLENSLQTMNDEYQTKLQKFTDEQKTLDPLIAQSKQKELVTMQQNIQQFTENAQQLYQQKQSDLMQPILEKIQKAINEVGKEGGFTYIFDLASQSIAYYSSDSQDVTDLVKQKLNIKASGAAKPVGAGAKK